MHIHWYCSQKSPLKEVTIYQKGQIQLAELGQETHRQLHDTVKQTGTDQAIFHKTNVVPTRKLCVCTIT